MDKKHKKHKLTYFITGGGTGGHIYPALAIFEELLKKDTTKDIYYIGNRKNLEYGIIRSKNYKFLDVDVEGMPRKAAPHFFMWGVKLFLAVIINSVPGIKQSLRKPSYTCKRGSQFV